MPCKTRQAALRGERSKPHYYLSNRFTNRFNCPTPPMPGRYEALSAFEARIDWSTWGASR